jgi:sarcosine oxidase gamma subunit
MQESHDVLTQTAFIMGKIMVTGMTGRGYSPEVRIAAQGDGRSTEVRAKSEATYVLLVSPGEWSVVAEVGGVASEPKRIALVGGQTIEINFHFGRQS